MELTDQQKSLLADCENEFSERYTEKDTEFMELKNKPLSKPPIVDPWGNNFNRNQQRGGGHRPYGQYGRDRHSRGGQSWNRNSQDSFSRRDHDGNRHMRDRPYEDRGPHYRDRSYDDRTQNRDRSYHGDRAPQRERSHTDDHGHHREERHHREDGHHQSRYHPY
ncbi:RNA guanine-N7 methyltransferase activating subunit-like [Daphnia carinata]|uniref:RNA guanine-N7 methyltransferase activating subunit-like n=1 Tax=Daphnia carinata TaxID=120202 RepID=UPI00257DBFC3|nr:RNA guanine-N7 methyltransferase activating subunit-like [Daphnia carinata]